MENNQQEQVFFHVWKCPHADCKSVRTLRGTTQDIEFDGIHMPVGVDKEDYKKFRKSVALHMKDEHNGDLTPAYKRNRSEAEKKEQSRVWVRVVQCVLCTFIPKSPASCLHPGHWLHGWLLDVHILPHEDQAVAAFIPAGSCLDYACIQGTGCTAGC